MTRTRTTPRPRHGRRLVAVGVGLAVLGGASSALAREGVGDLVWDDLNTNGRADAGEPGIPGVVVTLERDGIGAAPDCVSDSSLAYPALTTVTNATGHYFFPEVGAGWVYIELAPQNFTGTGPLVGYTSSTGSVLTTGPFEPGIPESNDPTDNNQDHGTVVGDRIKACNVELRPGTEPVGEGVTPGFPQTAIEPDNNLQSTVDFGVTRFAPPGTPPVVGGPGGPGGGARAIWRIGDRVWSDVDRDGIQDRGEPPLSGVEVRLLDIAGNRVGTTTTDRIGRYRFDGLLPGSFRVSFAKLPLLARPSPARRGPSRARDSNVLPNLRTELIAVSSGVERMDIDAGFIVQPAISGVVWRDADRDGQRDANERGVRGIRVELQTAAGRVVGTRTTNAGGRYAFVRLAPGRYRIVISELPAGRAFTRANRGDDRTDSDVLPAQRRTAILVLGRGVQLSTTDAGLR